MNGHPGNDHGNVRLLVDRHADRHVRHILRSEHDAGSVMRNVRGGMFSGTTASKQRLTLHAGLDAFPLEFQRAQGHHGGDGSALVRHYDKRSAGNEGYANRR